jgi:hypothetical protein
MNKLKGYANDPELARESAYKSNEAWKKNGRKPRGFAANPELAREASRKALEKARLNRIRSK